MKETNSNPNTCGKYDYAWDHVNDEKEKQKVAFPKLAKFTMIISVHGDVYLIEPVIADFPRYFPILAIYCKSHAFTVDEGACYNHWYDPSTGDDLSRPWLAVDFHGRQGMHDSIVPVKQMITIITLF